MDELVVEDFLIDGPVYIVCSMDVPEQNAKGVLAKTEQVMTEDGARAICIFTDRDLAEQLIQDKGYKTCEVIDIPGVKSFDNFLEKLEQNDYPCVTFDPRNQRDKRAVFHYVAKLRQGLRSQHPSVFEDE